MTTKMKIAAPVTSSGMIDNHFGHCDAYQVFSISEEKKIEDVEIVSSPQGCGCKSDIAQVLAAKGVSIMLAGGIGNGAVNVLKRSGIDVVRGCSGMAPVLVNQFLAGALKDSGEVCQQHEHEPGHVCSH